MSTPYEVIRNVPVAAALGEPLFEPEPLICLVCHRSGPGVIELSTGMTIHRGTEAGGCWNRLRKEHVGTSRAFTNGGIRESRRRRYEGPRP